MIKAGMAKSETRHGIFQIAPENRDVSDFHALKLAHAMSERYLLDLYPIVVTAQGIVIDGQHRLRATEISQPMRPYYYLPVEEIDGSVTVKDIAKANGHILRYSDVHIMQTFARMGIPAYQFLAKAAESYQGITPRAIAAVVDSDYDYEAFTVGLLKIDLPDLFGKAMKIVEDWRYCYNLAAPPRFGVKTEMHRMGNYRAMAVRLALSKNYDHEYVCRKMQDDPERIYGAKKIGSIESLLLYYQNKDRTGKKIEAFDVPSKEMMLAAERGVENIPYQAIPARRVVTAYPSLPVYREDDLSKLSLHPSASPTRIAHVAALADAIEVKNLLRYFPLIVDRDGVILDGSRRYLAAKKLGLPVYYIVAENFSLYMATIAGGTILHWTKWDYLLGNAAIGMSQYVAMRDFIDEIGGNAEKRSSVRLSLSDLIEIFTHENSSSYATAKFVEGKAVFDLASARRMIRVLDRLARVSFSTRVNWRAAIARYLVIAGESDATIDKIGDWMIREAKVVERGVNSDAWSVPGKPPVAWSEGEIAKLMQNELERIKGH